MNSEIDTTLLLFFVPKLVDMYIVFEEKLLVYSFCLQIILFFKCYRILFIHVHSGVLQCPVTPISIHEYVFSNIELLINKSNNSSYYVVHFRVDYLYSSQYTWIVGEVG